MFVASDKVGHLVYWVGESGHNRVGLRYRPLLSHRIIVSMGLLLLWLCCGFWDLGADSFFDFSGLVWGSEVSMTS